MRSNPLQVLKQYWGFDSFRPLQEDIIQSTLDGKDTLALLPTGGGKSICFQVPALCREGICLVISPLIALMKDQVQNLQKRGIPAVAIYSGMHYKEIDRLFDNCVYGKIKFLYLSPERLGTEMARERIKKMKVNLVAVDEAHCISQWGYDFRPSYLQITEIRELLPEVPVLALTATATADVVEDIQEKLSFAAKNVFRKSFDRSNLAYVVLEEEGKREKLIDILKKVPGSGIVYARNRRQTKEIAFFLRKNKIFADFYHAGLSNEQRSDKQDAWVNNRLRIMVATNAFGMGIDKPDVRVVVHLDLPDSLEAYFQEAGRAGRDGKKAFAILLYNDNDRRNLERNFELSFPKLKEIRRTYQALGSYFQLATGSGLGESFDFNVGEFAQNFQLDILKTFNCLKVLKKEGWIDLSDAVFIPSSLRIAVSKELLYDYQLKNPQFDPLLKTILRTYQGAFQHFVNINEKRLAAFLKISPGQMGKAFRNLQQAGIIDYRPQKEQPQLTFLRERVDPKNLTIDTDLFNFRKKRYRHRIKKSVAYAGEPTCRSQQLLRYFGQTDAETCGRCDVCLGRTKTELSTEEFERYKTKIAKILEKESLLLKQVVEAFAPHREYQVLKAIEYLLDNGLIQKEGEELTWKA